MKYRELTRKLRRLGCDMDRQAKGDQEIWIRVAIGARTTIPNWGSRDLRTGTVSSILKDLRIPRDDFNRA